MKKLIISILTAFSLLLTVTFISKTTKVSADSDDYSYEATTKTTLPFTDLRVNNKGNGYIIPSAKEAKEYHLTINAKIKPNTKIKFNLKPFLKKGNVKYYLVEFRSKGFNTAKYQGDKGLFPCIGISNFNQLKHVHKVKD